MALDVALPLLALLLLGRKKKHNGHGASTMTVTSMSPRRSAPKGGKVDMHATGGADTAKWARERYGAAHDWLVSEGFDDPDAHDMALSALAHWSIETGAGANEYNFNLGGIHARSGDQHFHSTDHDANGKAYPADYVAYDTLVQSVADYFELLAGGYPLCWQKLQSNPTEPDWFICLGKSGYFVPVKDGGASWAARRALLEQYAST